MRLFITGATGYFGRNLLAKIIEAGHDPLCLIRLGSEKKITGLMPEVEAISGDITDMPAWRFQLMEMKNIDAFINLVGIIREFPSRGITYDRLHFQATKQLADLAKEMGIKRFIQMSALGASPDSKAEYHRSKYRAEEYLKNSGLEWTIFRPSLIMGQGNGALETIIKLMDTAPRMPIIGSGKYRMQPVDVDNVTDGFVQSLEAEKTFGKIYEIGGPEQFSYDKMIDKIAEIRGKKIKKLHIPTLFMKMSAEVFEYFSFFPLSKGQINMLLEENITDSDQYFKDFKIKPISFEESLKKALSLN